MFKRFLHITSFFRPPIQFTAKEILEYSKIQYENAIDSEFFVNEDTPNLNIYSTMKNNNLNYIKVLDNSSENKMMIILMIMIMMMMMIIMMMIMIIMMMKIYMMK